MTKKLDLPGAVFAVFSILYPVIAVAMTHAWGPAAALVFLMAMLGARLALPALRGVPASMTLVLLPVMMAVLAVSLFDAQLSVRLYPVFMNVALLATFAATLWHPPSMIERFARILEPNLPDQGVRYTYKVTIVWMAFFGLNGAIALWSVLQPGWAIWTIYNGFVAYVAAGLLLGGEYIVRQRVIKRHGA